MQKDNLLRALRDLAELYQAGGLTREEFESTKALLMAQMRRVNDASSHPHGDHLSPPHRQHPAPHQTTPPRRSRPSSRPPSKPSSRPPQKKSDPTFAALDSLLTDLHQLQQQGALDRNTAQAGQQYLLHHLQPEGTQPSGPSHHTSHHSPPHALATSDPVTHTPPTGPVPQVITPGQTLLGRYYLERLLGQGGMGQVFLCYDKVREGQYALKVIHPHLAQYDDLRQRFLQELKVTERLTHPGIVRTYTLEQDPQSGFLFFTMEYVQGMTLESLLRQAEEAERVPPLPLETLVSVLEELVQILTYAHEQGVIHRDLKPSNIMIGEQYRVKLMDFGIAKVLEGTSVSKHTGFGGFVYYMAPEQLRGGGIVSPASDVFSLGVISYQLLTGEIPMGTIEPPSALWTDLPTEVDKVVLKAMSPRAHQRYATPRDYWKALRASFSPLLEGNGSHSSHRDRPTRPVSLDEVLEKIQQSNPQDAIELSANADLPSQLAQQLLSDLSAVEPPLSKGKTPTPAETEEPFQVDSSDVYPDLDMLYSGPSLPDTSLSASLELTIGEEFQSSPPPPAAPISPPKPGATALSLPAPPKGIEERTLYAKDNTPLLRMVRIPEGPFLMGSLTEKGGTYEYEAPQRSVNMDAYWIARTPVTHKVWWKFMQESGYPSQHTETTRLWKNGAPPTPLLEHPIVDVSMEDIRHFCQFYQVSLPSEAQWEKAARGLDGQIWPWGDEAPTPELCNFLDSELGHTTPVTKYPEGISPFGLLDCSGNTWEWCRDHWNIKWLEEMGDEPENPVFRQRTSSPPETSQRHVQYSIRGGCYRYHARGVRCAFRYSASAPAPYIGFRIVQTR